MAKTRLSDADRLRLAVAIAVLRSKPQELSVSSYVLDLHAKFLPSGPVPPTPNNPWRTYALALEHDLEQLKEKYELQRMELLASSNDLTPHISSSVASSDPQPTPDSFPAKPSRKKAKTKKAPGSSDVKTALKQRPHLDLSSVPQGPRDQLTMEIPRNSELLLALRAFGKAASDSNKDGSTLLHATLHVIRIASLMLESAIDHPTTMAASHITFSVLGRALSHIITSSVPPISLRQEPTTVSILEPSEVDRVFDLLIENIFGPIIRAFGRMTHCLLSGLLGEPSCFNGGPASPKKSSLDQEPDDLRPDLLRFFQMLVESLRSASLRAHRKPNSRWAISLSSLKASLILEVTRELGKILFPTPYAVKPFGAIGPDTEPANRPQNHETCVESRVWGLTVPGPVSVNVRVKRLVAKDALWYLCSLMHILADLPKPEGLKLPSAVMPGATLAIYTPAEPDLTKHEGGMVLLELLHDAILSTLYDLVLKCQPTVDQLEKDHERCLGRSSHIEPMNNKPHTFDDVREIKDYGPTAISDPQPMRIKYNVNALRAGVPLTSGSENLARNSQAQGRSSPIIDSESEVGDPGGRDLRTIRDSSKSSAPAGGAQCDSDARIYGVPNQGGADEVTNTSHRPLSGRQSELGSYSSDVAGSATECLIDEAGFMMLLGVVERYILDPEYTR